LFRERLGVLTGFGRVGNILNQMLSFIRISK